MDARGRPAAARRIQETRDLKPAVLELCQLLRLHVAHFRPARMKDGRWRTPVEADGKGFLDLVIVGYDVLWRELKTFGRKPTRAQLEWMARLEQAGQDAGVWTGGGSAVRADRAGAQSNRKTDQIGNDIIGLPGCPRASPVGPCTPATPNRWRQIVTEPTPKKTSTSTSAQAVTLCVLFVCVAAVCIVGMFLAAEVYR